MATSLVEQFDRMVTRDGGEVLLIGVEDDVVRVGYRVGAVDPTCVDGSCVMPHVELQELMGETLARRDPGLRLIVEVIT